MNRRNFMKASLGMTLMTLTRRAAFADVAAVETDKIRFGILTDLHYARRKSYGKRFFEHTIPKLEAAMNVFNKSNLDFIVEVGDFKDMGGSSAETLVFLDEIERAMRQFDGGIYHVLGNHDMDNISKADFLAHTKNRGAANGKAHYSFVHKNIKFIMLDANFNSDGTDYDSGNFDWTQTYIPEPQLEWLAAELDSPYSAVVFVHQLLDGFSGIYTNECVNNWAQAVAILERRGNVLAVFQGHYHEGWYSFRRGIHYFTLKRYD